MIYARLPWGYSLSARTRLNPCVAATSTFILTCSVVAENALINQSKCRGPSNMQCTTSKWIGPAECAKRLNNLHIEIGNSPSCHPHLTACSNYTTHRKCKSRDKLDQLADAAESAEHNSKQLCGNRCLGPSGCKHGNDDN